jgi:hypothetical protein
MPVTVEQWAAAAADAGLTLDELHAKIAEIDDSDQQHLPRRLRSWSRDAAHQTGPPLHFDRDGDPLTTGEWAVLISARSYKFIAAQVLPNRYWIATIWTGIDDGDGDDPPIVLETSVFLLYPEWTRLPSAVHRVVHASLADALRVHGELVNQFAAAGLGVA